MLNVTTKGFANLERILKTESARQEKALNTAVKVEGYRLMRLLKKQIRAGAPGGQKFPDLTYLSRVWTGGSRLGPNKPLKRLAVAVRYFVQNLPFEFRVGWTGPKVSKSWKRIAKLQQEGFIRPVTQSLRKSFARSGSAMPIRSKAKIYMFLRKSTKTFKTPARPIIDPFWRSEKGRAWRNIRRNYQLKLQGRRI